MGWDGHGESGTILNIDCGSTAKEKRENNMPLPAFVFLVVEVLII